MGQRQIWQTANVEAVRQAQEVSEHIQREEVRKKVADDSAAEEQAGVRVIPKADPMRAEERKERQRQEKGSHEGEGEPEPEALTEETEASPETASEPQLLHRPLHHLDFLA